MLLESPGIRVELDDQIATLWLDSPKSADNRFNLELLDQLENALRAVQRAPAVDVLLIRSAKVNVFSPGYDLNEIGAFTSAAARSAFAARGQQITQLLANLGQNTLTAALVDGECRSGGLEIALACDYRVAVARPATVFGFPEVSNGLLPCWGGSLRLPRLIGMNRALEMLLKGKEATAREAYAIGLVDGVFDEQRARIDLHAFLDRLQDSPRKLAAPRRLSQRLRDGLSFGRWLTLQRTDAWLADIEDGERPAARAVIKAIWAGYSSAPEALAAERSLFAELAATPACRNALRLSALASTPTRIHPEPINPAAEPPERIGIVGGGELGSALAGWFALRGRQIALQEYCEESLQLTNDRLDRFFADAVGAGMVAVREAEHAKKNIRRTTAWNGFDRAQFIIEAVDEDLGMKRGIFHELEQRVRPRTILASTSSTIRIEAIQAELQRPGRVAGLHFLDASNANPFVEIVRSPITDSVTLAALSAWLRFWSKTPLLVSDRPGRLVGRIQLAYLSEAVHLISEGLPPEAIDREVRRFGMKNGPLEIIDRIGFDNLAHLVENLQLARGDGFAQNLLLDRMRSYGFNGRENGEGFYRYRRGRARPNHLARMISWNDNDDDAIGHYIFDPRQALVDSLERLVLRTINEAAACLPDERDADPESIDLALALGAGWAPHRGGPLRHADQLGLVAVVERLTEFAERFGKRFEPCVELQRRAEAGESFYDSPVTEKSPDYQSRRRLAG